MQAGLCAFIYLRNFTDLGYHKRVAMTGID